ncbi:MAG: hypothetical protein KI788_06285 [Mameliella sp.]|nr:hypothetical protein [Mameliella sp.]
MSKSIWAAITQDDESGELDVTLHDREGDAQCAIMNEVHELYGDDYVDNPPPDEFDEELLSQWCGDNLINFNWRVKEIR